MRILTISYSDHAGGAERIALDLHREYLRRGHDAQLVVGVKVGSAPSVSGLTNGRRFGGRVAMRLLREAEYWSGVQGVISPLFRLWLARRPGPWDVVHCHNLHGGYFALADLKTLATRAPVVMTLHDFWLCTGHCAYALGCQKWLAGCGRCPHLSRYPGVHTDRTRGNASMRASLIRQTRPLLVAPSRWAAGRINASRLGCRCSVIPNGVDTGIYRPMDKASARRSLGLPEGGKLMLYVSHGGLTGSYFKDPQTLLRALRILRSRRGGDSPRLLVVGGRGGVPRDLEDSVIQVAHVTANMEMYYNAADVLVHPTKSETFGLVLAEAMACGTAVVATRVGACPELITDGVNGYLVATGSATALAEKVCRVLEGDLAGAGPAGRSRVKEYFDMTQTASNYLELYRQAISA